MTRKILPATLVLVVVLFFGDLGWQSYKKTRQREILAMQLLKKEREQKLREERKRKALEELEVELEKTGKKYIHREDSPVYIKDFKIFIKEFKKALREKNWARVHAMWEHQSPEKWLHPDIEESEDNAKDLLKSQCNSFPDYGWCQYKYKTSGGCWSATLHYIQEEKRERWVYSGINWDSEGYCYGEENQDYD